MPGPWGVLSILYSKVCSDIVFECYPDLFLNTNHFYYYYFKNIQNLALPKIICSEYGRGILYTLKYSPIVIT